MPSLVKKVRWKCKGCQKSFWLMPWKAQEKIFCSRACHHKAMRVENPVRLKRGAKKTYGDRECLVCLEGFVAQSVQQKYCSQACALKAVWERNKDKARVDRPCVTCGKIFRPVHTRNAGKFCSRACFAQGAKGSGHVHWRGGRHITAGGYVKLYAPNHPMANGHGGYIAEHRLVMEKMLGRFLLPGENVHHKNGQKDDNREENLELWIKKQPQGQRVEDQVRWARELLRLYGHLFPEAVDL